jgi:adenylosuccinate synthase
MLLDVLSELDEIKICEAYELDGQRTTDFPSHVEDLARVKPIFRTLPGWQSDVSHVRRYADFPARTQQYIETVGQLVGAPVDIMSVGPDREQTVIR